MKHDIDMKLRLKPPYSNTRTPIVNVLLTIMDRSTLCIHVDLKGLLFNMKCES